MLVNPGGPGGSGLALSLLGATVPGHAGDAYDWIGFDPRGVGASTPALSCISDYGGYNRPEYDPTKAPGVISAWQARAEQLRGGVRDQGRRAAQPPDHRGRRQGPGHASARPWAPSRSTSTASPTAPTSARSTPRSSRRTCGARCSTASSTTAACGTRTTSTRTSRSRRRSRCTSTGSRRTTRSTTSATPARTSRSCTTPSATSCAPSPRAARSALGVDRHLPAGRLLRLRLGEDRLDVREVGAQPRRRRAEGALRRHGLGRRRQRLRDLPGRPVHRHAVAAAVRPGARRQRTGGAHGAVRDLGQRLVQRPVPDVEGARAHAGGDLGWRPRRRSC